MAQLRVSLARYIPPLTVNQGVTVRVAPTTRRELWDYSLVVKPQIVDLVSGVQFSLVSLQTIKRSLLMGDRFIIKQSTNHSSE